MREILFRARRDYDGKWVYGYPVQYLYLPKSNEYWKMETINENSTSLTTHSIRPTTICEYSGLNDKNGTKIFDGDIVTRNGKPLIVRFDDFQWKLVTDDNQYRHRLEYEDNGKWEVIGNIYDNPKLLRGEQ